MKQEALTAKQVQYVKPDPAKRKEVPCGPPAGLYCVVYSSGAKSFALRYRWHGRPKKLTFSKPYPELSLAGARADAEAALDLLKSGIDPAAAKAEEEALAPNTVGAIAAEWLTRKVDQTRSRRFVGWILNGNILPVWKHRLITEISRPDVLRLLDSIVDRGSPVVANRTRSILVRLFGWCMERGYVETSPLANIKPPVREKSRDRVLSERELTDLFAAGENVGFPFGPFTKLLILTAQRRGEVAGMRWRDIDFDKALWTLPAEQTKPGRIHDVPLSRPTLDVFRSLPRFEGEYVFTTTSGLKPINSFSKAQSRLKAEILRRNKEIGFSTTEIPDWTIHDIRRTVATYMASMAVPAPVLSALLNHSPGKVQGITAVYNRFRYVEERRAALEAWAGYVLALAEEKPKRKAGAA